jgi:hypothetical protein
MCRPVSFLWRSACFRRDFNAGAFEVAFALRGCPVHPQWSHYAPCAIIPGAFSAKVSAKRFSSTNRSVSGDQPVNWTWVVELNFFSFLE